MRKQVWDLQEAIVTEKNAVNRRFDVPRRLLTLFLARKKGETAWLKDDDSLDIFLKCSISNEHEEMRPSRTLDDKEYFGPDFTPGDEEIHVLVELPKYKQGVKRQKVHRNTSLAGLWELSELRLAALPAPHQLAELLQKPLPFKLTLRDSVVTDRVFNPDGLLLSCPDVTLLMDY